MKTLKQKVLEDRIAILQKECEAKTIYINVLENKLKIVTDMVSERRSNAKY